ncbi:MAG: peptide chain release factor 2 [candidate division NC10 bacterium]|nr:peptide chain release factor 2 [candidate division NC10 bacterium]
MIPDMQRMVDELQRKLDQLGCIFDLPGKAARLEALEKAAAAPEFWSAPEAAQKALKEQSDLRQTLEGHGALLKVLEDQRVLLGLAVEEEDGAALAEVEQALAELAGQVRALELTTALSGEYDKGNAILSINAGAGGTESQDWAQMLLRMYLRWAERKRFRSEVIDMLEGEEAGIKNVTVTLEGTYAYGYLRPEIGVHRLVRISPFDANKRRHTSFASVFVYPEISDDIDVNIDEKDLRIDTYRSGGHGGQHINVTDSAVRITHLPTGIVASCQNERSQHKNKAMAMKVLRARLYEHYKAQRAEELSHLEGTKQAIAWGSQIRSYVLAPYQLVKDHRTGEETGNVTAVLDGEIDRFVESFLFKPPEASTLPATPSAEE